MRENSAPQKANPLVLWLRQLGRAMKRAARTIAEMLLVALVAFYEWGWRPLADILASLARFPWFARLEARIAGLPPYGALALFATPAVVLFPVKLFALYLLASGRPIVAILLIALAKIVGTAFVARVFILTQPQLMQIGWFKRAYDWFMPWKKHVFELVKASLPWRIARVAARRVRRGAIAAWRSSLVVSVREWARAKVLRPARRYLLQARSAIGALIRRGAL